MLSSSNIESLIAVKRREIEEEKTALGLSAPREPAVSENDKENLAKYKKKVPKQVNFAERIPCEHNEFTEEKENLQESLQDHTDFDERIPPDLERYIRRYIGLPVMLKAGEYSPNNPLVRGERAPGDALLGLGEYERRRNTLRKIRQQQYREYLDQQAKKKQEAKQQAERERREREQKEKEREERERELLEERERHNVERRRSVQCVTESSGSYSTKVDTGVQVDGGFHRPLSVAVQTDETELFRLSPSPTKSQLTQAERELSPRSVGEARWPALHNHWSDAHRRRSYGDYDERTSSLVKSNRDKLTSDLRHTYMPSIFDADAIQRRNMQAEKEAAERRQYYQQELKNQILEQQRIREERKNREKMLEQAEMRRLEEQLRMLRVAQEREVGKQREITAAMTESTSYYNDKRTELQREIDAEQQKLFRAVSQPNKSQLKRNTNTSHSDTMPSKLPFYYSTYHERTNEICDKKPFSINIPDNSLFSSNYDVDSYLRRNLNFNKEKVSNRFETETPESPQKNKNIIVEKAIIHAHEERNDRPENTAMEKSPSTNDYKNVEIIEKPSNNVVTSSDVDTLPIPVLRHSPKRLKDVEDLPKMSEAMRKVDDKWKVPVVQKNILKALPNEEGKNVNILTQLGSIRRQLQLEQLKLDRLSKDDHV